MMIIVVVMIGESESLRCNVHEGAEIQEGLLEVLRGALLHVHGWPRVGEC